MLTPAATAQRPARIEALVDRLDNLATKAREGMGDYQQFETVLGDLHAAGFLPAGNLVSAVASAFIRG
jgi:hypothetical protein